MPQGMPGSSDAGGLQPVWGMAASPLQDPTGKQGTVAAVLPTWLPLSASDTS